MPATGTCDCFVGWGGTYCDACDAEYVDNPQNPGECILDPCRFNPCDDYVTCSEDDTQLIDYTGNCTVLGPGSYDCEIITMDCVDTCLNDTCIIGYDPTPGDIVFTEIMVEPAAVAASAGQWLEIYNASANVIKLNGMTFTAGGASLPVGGPTITMDPGQYMVVANNTDSGTNGGVTAQAPMTGMLMSTSSGTATAMASDGTTVIDQVVWDSSWPFVSGHSISLSPAALSGTPGSLNDTAAHWCLAQSQWGGGDYGSPVSQNDPCAPNWCNVQWPQTITVTLADGPQTVYGQVYEPGLTEGDNPTPFITAWLGYGGVGTTPDDSWNWVQATMSTSFDPGSNNEEFSSSIDPGVVGSWHYAYKMSMDGGLSWYYCDKAGTPYSTANACTITVNP